MNRGIFALCIFLVSFVSLLASAQTLSLVAATGFDKVAAYQEVIEFVSDILTDAGFKVKLVEVPRKRGAFAVDSGEFDALPIRGLDDAKDLPNLIVTSFPLGYTIFRVVSLSSHPKFSESKLQDFSGAIVLNNASLQAEAKRRQLKMNEVNASYPDLVKMLSSKRVEYIIMPEEFIDSILDQNTALKNLLRISKNTFVKTPLYFSMNKKHQALMPKIEKSLRKALQGDLSRYKYIRKSLNKNLERSSAPSPEALKK